VGQWLTTLEVLAAANTNKKLTTLGIFVPSGSSSTIVMVNGGLMAKATSELFQQAVNHFVGPLNGIGPHDDLPMIDPRQRDHSLRPPQAGQPLRLRQSQLSRREGGVQTLGTYLTSGLLPQL
jgi:hypothetical protein